MTTVTTSIHGAVDPVEAYVSPTTGRYGVDINTDVTVFGEAQDLAGLFADRLTAVCEKAGLFPAEVVRAAAARRDGVTEGVPA